tara:strand:+ start:442 stop:798 length:357 start_codon:yes stop_codon:yes gene_type:complete
MRDESMNLEVLQHIVENEPGMIEALAKENGLDPSASIGVAEFLIGNDGDISLLSAKQRYHYDNDIEPLVDNVPCDGVFGEGTCTGNGVVDDESLLGCYLEDNFLCQHCQYDSNRIAAE